MSDQTNGIPLWQQAPIVAGQTDLPDAPFIKPPPGFEIAQTPISQLPDAPFVRAAAPSKLVEGLKANLRAGSRGPATADSFLDALKAGFQLSDTGLFARGQLPDTELATDAPWYMRAGRGAAQLAGDLPFMVGGFGMGAAGGAVTGPGAAVTGTAAAFAVPAFIRSQLMDGYANGLYSSPGEFWQRESGVIWETIKAGITGAATGAAGVGARAFIPVSAPAAIKLGAPTATELAAMVSVGSALEGHAPAAQDFLDAAIVLGGLKGAGRVVPGLRAVYERTGKAPAEVVADANQDPNIARDLGAAPDVAAAPGTLPRAYEGLAAAERARQIVPGTEAAAVAASPFAESIPQAKGEPTRPTHINYNYLETADDVKLALARLSEINEPQIQAQRRGTVSWQETEAEATKLLADTIGATDTRLLQPREPGTPAGAAEILARKQLVLGAAEDMALRARDLLAKREGGMATLEDQVQFVASIERARLVHEEFLGARAEIGRALNILKDTKRDAQWAAQVNDVMRTYSADPLKLAEMVSTIDNPAGALKFAREAAKATTWEKLVEGWKAGLLSGPVTHVANVLGNTTFMALRVPIDAVAAGIGKLHGGERVEAGEALARLAGILQGSRDGLRVGWRTLRDGGAGPKSEQYREAIGADPDSTPAARTAGKIIRTPFRMLSAADAVFNTMNGRGEAYTLAVRAALTEGLNPRTREFRERVASAVQNPTADMQQQIDAAALRFTFNTELGAAGQKLQGFVKAAHLEWAVPFIRTPLNIAKELARMTPAAPLLGEWRADIKAGGARRDKAVAEIMVGQAAMASVFMLALDGQISGAGEPDAGKKRVQRAAGWQPYSVKLGDTWYSYQRIQPLGTLMGLAADAAEVWDHMQDADERDHLAKMLAVAFANAVTNQTFLQGITNVVNVLSEPTRYGGAFAENLARSLVPNAIGQTAEMMDPLARNVDNALDAIRARIPGLREQLLPKRDVFGEPVAATDRLAGVLPVTRSVESSDKVRSEAARLNVSVGDAPKKTHVGRGSGKLGNVPLEPAERDVFADVSGHLAHQILEPMVNAPGWDKLPDLVQRRVYSKVFAQANRAGAIAALPMDKRVTALQQITQKIEAELASEEE